jgi:hypothetical protein
VEKKSAKYLGYFLIFQKCPKKGLPNMRKLAQSGHTPPPSPLNGESQQGSGFNSFTENQIKSHFLNWKNYFQKVRRPHPQLGHKRIPKKGNI